MRGIEEPDWDKRKRVVADFLYHRLKYVNWYAPASRDEVPRVRYDGDNYKKIRLDFEFLSEQLEHMLSQEDQDRFVARFSHQASYLPKIIRDRITTEMSRDLADLVVDGDTNSTDPLLKTFDGERKLGIEFARVDLPHILWYAEFQPMRDSFGFTIYTLIEGAR